MTTSAPHSADPVQRMLGLEMCPVALTFLAEAPRDVPRAPRSAPAGCAYWERAGRGEAFYTTAEDHSGCPIGAYTHGLDLPATADSEFAHMVEQVIGLGYMGREEIAEMPRRPEPFRYLVYAPIGVATTEADVVLLRGNFRQLMLLHEAAIAAGIAGDATALGRPTCALVPEVLRRNSAVSSFGCIGNRVYTHLQDGESYMAVPGPAWERFVESLSRIVEANRALERFHLARD